MLKPKGHQRCHGRFLDDAIFLPLAERAVKLDIPLYLHPGLSTETFRREPYTGHGPSVSYALRTEACTCHAGPNCIHSN
jgi:hypothetical protein